MTNWKLSIPAPVLIRICYVTYDSAWIANSHAVGRNIMNHNTSSAYDYIIPNGNPRHNLYPCAKPDIISNRNWICIFQSSISSFKINWMS